MYARGGLHGYTPALNLHSWPLYPDCLRLATVGRAVGEQESAATKTLQLQLPLEGYERN